VRPAQIILSARALTNRWSETSYRRPTPVIIRAWPFLRCVTSRLWMFFLVVGDDLGVFSLELLQGVGFANELAASSGGVDSSFVLVCIIL